TGVVHGSESIHYRVSIRGGSGSVTVKTPVTSPIDFLSLGSPRSAYMDSSDNAVIYYTVQHGVAKRDKREIDSGVMTNDWTTLNTFTAPSSKATRLTGRFRVTWNAADRGVYYGMRIVVDRKSTRLNSSHVSISYAVFCLKKKIEMR